MNQMTQFDAHPEAEVLNGFAEQALGAVEREDVLGHLAVCARCREIVALARKAAAAEMPVAVGPARKAWLGGMQLAWVPAVALAAMAVVAVFVYVRHKDDVGEMARVEAPVKPSVELGAAAPAAVAPVEQVQAKKQAVSKSADESAAFGSGSAGLVAEVSSVEAAAPPPAAALSSTADKAASFQMAEARALDQASAARDSVDAAQQTEHAAQSRMKMAVASAPPMQMAGGSAAPVAAMRAMPAAPAAVRQAATLPGGQAVVSSASNGALMVAVDAGGEVFVSRDRGQHWDAVKQQWTGRAVRVATKAGVAAVFEVTNDQQHIWASTDGVIWTAQ